MPDFIDEIVEREHLKIQPSLRGRNRSRPACAHALAHRRWGTAPSQIVRTESEDATFQLR